MTMHANDLLAVGGAHANHQQFCVFSLDLLARSVQKVKHVMSVRLSMTGKREFVVAGDDPEYQNRRTQGIGSNTVEPERQKKNPPKQITRPLCWKSIQFEARYRKWLCTQGGRL